MARKPTTRTEFVLFDVFYEDGTQRSNRRVPGEILGGLDGDEPARAAMARVPREINAQPTPPYEPFARTTLAIEWTRRPTYCVVPQSGPNKTGTAVTHWVDVYCGPITFQIRDQLGLTSTLALLSRTHKTAVAVFLDGPAHAADPTADDYPGPS